MAGKPPAGTSSGTLNAAPPSDADWLCATAAAYSAFFLCAFRRVAAACAFSAACVANGMTGPARCSFLACEKSLSQSSEPPESIGRLHAQKKPRRARERATHTRLSTLVNPSLPFAFERTSERRMISFSSPW